MLILNVINKGVAYKADRTVGPSICSHIPRNDEDLNIPADIDFPSIDILVKTGFARESTWKEYTNLVLTYKGRKRYLQNNGFDFNNWRGIFSQYICCAQAIPRFCVCRCSTMCSEHGTRCNGSHD